MTEIDQSFERAGPSPVSLGDWMEMVDIHIRRSLRNFASVVDVESVLQETLMQMWVLAQGDERASLRGENASLWFAIAKARHIARDAARRAGNEALLPPEEAPSREDTLRPDPRVQRLYEALYDCMRMLKDDSFRALRWRQELSWHSDAVLAERCQMDLNTFSRAVITAKRQIAGCIERQGIVLEGWEVEREHVVTDEELEARLCSTASAYRQEEDGRPIPPPGWWEMTPRDRERAFWLRLMTTQMEMINGTLVAVTFRIARSLPKVEAS